MVLDGWNQSSAPLNPSRRHCSWSNLLLGPCGYPENVSSCSKQKWIHRKTSVSSLPSLTSRSSQHHWELSSRLRMSHWTLSAKHPTNCHQKSQCGTRLPWPLIIRIHYCFGVYLSTWGGSLTMRRSFGGLYTAVGCTAEGKTWVMGWQFHAMIRQGKKRCGWNRISLFSSFSPLIFL